jgi:hypothetical protein
MIYDLVTQLTRSCILEPALVLKVLCLDADKVETKSGATAGLFVQLPCPIFQLLLFRINDLLPIPQEV